MRKLINDIYLLEETDTLKDLAFVFNNNFRIILYSLLSEPQTTNLVTSGPKNSLVTGLNLSFYDNRISVTGIQFINNDFDTVDSYITEQTKVNPNPTKSQLELLITTINTFSNSGRLKISDWVSILNGVITKYIIGTELSLTSWLCQPGPKLNISSSLSRLNKASTKLGAVDIKLTSLKDKEDRVREVNNFLNFYKVEFLNHIHDSTDIKTGLFNFDKLGVGPANVTTYLAGNKTWSKPPN